MNFKLLILLSALLLVNASRLGDKLLDELIKDYEESRWNWDGSDPRFCGHTGLDCYKCSECHDHQQYGLCINDNKPGRCLCKWGWTGDNAHRITDVGISEWSTNRIRADHCKTPCRYTHDHWNQNCAPEQPSCDEELCHFKMFGKCMDGKCVPRCDEEACMAEKIFGRCYHGECVEMVNKPPPKNTVSDGMKRDDIDPRFCGDTGFTCYKCSECHDHLQFGLCISDDQADGKCLCKWGWTGKNAHRITDVGTSKWSTNRIRADHCKTPCHYTHDFWNEKCLIDGGHIVECDEYECRDKYYGTCINDKCVPDCDDYECMTKYGTCIKGECIPDCDDDKCKKNYGTCIKGKCVPDCEEVLCKARYGTCKMGKCIPDCIDELCKLKYGTCKNGKCVPDCDNVLCKARYGRCKMGKCIPDCDEEDCKSKYGVCEKGKCIPTCNEMDCKNNGGKCVKGDCKICCINLQVHLHPYTGGNFELFCDARCHRDCEQHTVPACNPKCKALGGFCHEETGRCKCCKDFSGPNPKFHDDILTADYCDTYCPHYIGTKKNLLCENHDYVQRVRFRG